MGLFIVFVIFAFISSAFARISYLFAAKFRTAGEKDNINIITLATNSVTMMIGFISTLSLPIAFWLRPEHVFYYIGILGVLSIVNVDGWLIEPNTHHAAKKLECINLFFAVSTILVFVFLYHS